LPEQGHPEEYQKIMETYRKVAHFFEHTVQNHRIVGEQFKTRPLESSPYNYTSYGFAAYAKEVACTTQTSLSIRSRCTPTN
jgi:hypothetical protein